MKIRDERIGIVNGSLGSEHLPKTAGKVSPCWELSCMKKLLTRVQFFL